VKVQKYRGGEPMAREGGIRPKRGKGALMEAPKPKLWRSLHRGGTHKGGGDKTTG